MDTLGIVAKVEKLLKSCSLDGYEIYLASSRNLSIEVKEQKVDTFKCSAPVGVSVRVLKGGGLGFSFSTSLDEADLGRMVESALVGAQTQTPDEYNGLPLPLEYPVLGGLCDEELASVAESDKIDRATELERQVLAFDRRLKRVRKASYGESTYEVTLRNSHGVSGNYRGTSVSASVTAVAEEGGDSQMGWDFGHSNLYSGIEVEKIARQAAAKAVGLLGARKIATMRAPVVLDSYVAAEILEVLAPSFLADNVQKGKSMLAGRLGSQPFSSLLRIRDDGTLPGGTDTAPFDGEGVPQHDTVLVEGGRLLRFLYDSYTARKDGVSSTGNSARGGVKGPPRLGITNFFVENGTLSSADLLRGIDRGVLITEVLGMHTANAITGDFSVGAAGFLIEQGRAAHPVKGIAISGNIVDLFRDVEMVADDLRFYGGIGAPSLRIAALDVSGD